MSILYKCSNEGVGAQYNRIIGLLSIAKHHNLKYIHNMITVGHNYDNDPEWDKKWDDFFNIKSIAYVSNNNDSNNSNNTLIEWLNYNNLKDIQNLNIKIQTIFPFNIINKEPNTYYKIIQDDIRNAYNQNNSNKSLHLFKNKVNIAIHIRVINDHDDKFEYNNFYNSIGRFSIKEEEYLKLIEYFISKYPYADIHIFSQKNITQRYKSLTQQNNINLHLDTDAFDTFHHLCNADILVISKSAFSYLAGIYNKNKVVYPALFFHPPLDNWINFYDIV